MNKKIDYNDVPKSFLYCNHDKCPRRGKCLRYQVVLNISQKLPYYTTVNPQHIAGNENNCDFFKLNEITRFAVGMSHLLDDIPHATAIAIHKEIYSFMGRSMYYRILNKKRLLHPVEQEQIAAIFCKHGIKSKPVFDDYIDKYDW